MPRPGCSGSDRSPAAGGAAGWPGAVRRRRSESAADGALSAADRERALLPPAAMGRRLESRIPVPQVTAFIVFAGLLVAGACY